MATPLLESQIIFVKGEKKNLAIKAWDENNPTNDLSSATATIAVYDQSGAATLASGAATVSGTTLISISRLWDSSAVAPGSYRAAVTLTLGSIVQIFQFPIVVLPLPAPQTP